DWWAKHLALGRPVYPLPHIACRPCGFTLPRIRSGQAYRRSRQNRTEERSWPVQASPASSAWLRGPLRAHPWLPGTTIPAPAWLHQLSVEGRTSVAGDALRTALPEWIIVSRVLLAILLVGIIGLAREIRHRPAGLRTHIL